MIIDTIRRMFGGKPDGMTCEESLQLLNDYLDGELDSLAAAEVEEHFRMCQACYPHLKLEERFKDRLQSAGTNECCPDEVKASIRAALESAGD